MWVLIVLFQIQTFNVVLDSQADCLAMLEVNATYWHRTGQDVKALCMGTVEI